MHKEREEKTISHFRVPSSAPSDRSKGNLTPVFCYPSIGKAPGICLERLVPMGLMAVTMLSMPNKIK